MPKQGIKNLNCQDYALYLLSLRSQSSEMLRQKLERKKYEAKDIDAALSRLTELGYINDEQYAQTFFENLKKYKNFGFYGIKNKLILKKIPRKSIDKMLKTFTLAQEKEIASRFISQNARKSREQMARSMQSKGFRADVIFGLLGSAFGAGSKFGSDSNE